MDLQRPEKIIITMYKLSNGSLLSLKYEDIVVKAFKMFPHDFALRGYPEYPDSSDIHKPLYGPLKRAGLVTTGNKQFRLTSKGIEYAKRISGNGSSRRSLSSERLTRDKEAELNRIYKTDAFSLFSQGRAVDILDTDFYGYLGVSVRTGRNEFLGRLRVVQEAVDSGAAIVGGSSSKTALAL